MESMCLYAKQFEKGKVSVVIPVYNEERFLRQCLESVVNQADRVIIGDNASTDGSRLRSHRSFRFSADRKICLYSPNGFFSPYCASEGHR
jgi:glycosyltransferase involved in cell wall biosynthesis